MIARRNTVIPTAIRSLMFVTNVVVSASLVWFVPVVFFYVLQLVVYGLGISNLLPPIMAGSLGVFLAIPSSIGVRYIETAWRSSPITQYPLRIFWFFALGSAWWVIITSSLATMGYPSVAIWNITIPNSLVIISLATVLFYASDFVRRQLGIYRWKLLTRKRYEEEEEEELQRQRAFQLLPKTYWTQNQADVLGIISSMKAWQTNDESTGILSKSISSLLRKTRIDSDLQQMQLKISMLGDPRYNLPMPLPLSLRFMEQNIKTNIEEDKQLIGISIDSIQTFPEDMVIEPSVLCSAVTFAAEYALYRSRSRYPIKLDISYQNSPRPSIQIGTNLAYGDLWFVVNEGSPAQLAKLDLVQTINRFIENGCGFEVAENAHNNMTFSLWVREAPVDDKNTWEAVERALGPNAKRFHHQDRSQGTNRIYVEGDLVHKVQILGKRSRKSLVLAEEFQVLQRLKGIEGLPEVTDYQELEEFAVLSYKKIEGIPVDEYLQLSNLDRQVWFRIVAELSAILNLIHSRGVLHRDLRPDNILIGKNGEVYLIDFDQAVVGTHAARQVDTTGEAVDTIPVCISLRHLIRLLGLDNEYKSVVSELRTVWELGAQSDASSPGQGVAYYQWSFGYTDFPGERDWYARWVMVYKVLRGILPGARVLDLGCNQGLLAVYCMLYGAERVTGVDKEPNVLDAARKMAGSADVLVNFLEGDLDNLEFVYSNLQNQEYDLVIALSVIHWLQNHDSILKVLAATPYLLYEGHAPYSVEVSFLRDLGFDDIRQVGYSERLRVLFFASRRQIE